MPKSKYPKLTTEVVETTVDGTVVDRITRFTFKDEGSGEFTSALSSEWNGRPDTERLAEMRHQFDTWTAARTPPPRSEQDLQDELAGAVADHQAAASRIIDIQSEIIALGGTPQTPIIVQQAPQEATAETVP